MNRRKTLVASVALPLIALWVVACGSPQPPPPSAPQAEPAPARENPPPSEPTPPRSASPSPPPSAPASKQPVQSRATSRTAPDTSEPVADQVRDQGPSPVEPAPPEPEPIVKTVPSGTEFEVIFLDGLSSETAKAGDPFRARVAQDVRVDGIVVVPAGSLLSGRVTEAVPLRKIGGAAKLSLAFDRLELTTGSTVPIEIALAEQGKSQTKKDAATIGGAAAGGAVLGKLIGKHSKDALIGAVVGAGVGTAVAAKNKGEQVEIPVGTQMPVQLGRSVDVIVRR